MTGTACDECGRRQPAGATYCGWCGRALPMSATKARRTAGSPSRLRRAPWLALVSALAASALIVVPGLIDGDPREVDPGTSAGTGDVVLSTDATARPDSASGVVPAPVPDGVRCIVDDGAGSQEPCASWVVGLRQPDSTFTGVLAADAVVIASTDTGMVALEPATGTVRWEWASDPNPTEDDAVSSMRMSEGLVVAVLEAQHRIVAVDAEAGTTVWSVPIQEQRQAWLATGSPATGDETMLALREPGSLSVRRLHDGRQTWQRTLTAGGTEPIVIDGLVVSLDGDRLTAWDLHTGDRQWVSDVALEPGTAVISGSPQTLLVTSRRDELVAIDSRTGKQRWQTDPLKGLRQVIDLDEERLLTAVGQQLQVRDVASGRIQTTIPTDFIAAVGPGGPDSVFATVSTSIMRFGVAVAGETWTLQTVPPFTPAAFDVVTKGEQQQLVTVLDDRFLAAFTPPPPIPRHPDGHACATARPSEALGALDAWRGDRVHVSLQGEQLFVGITGADPSSTVTISASPVDEPGTVEFTTQEERHVPETVTLDTGARRASRFPPHWVVGARFSPTGCWDIRVSTEHISEVVRVPISAPAGYGR